MEKSKRTKSIVIVSVLAIVLLVAAILAGGHEKHESVREAMRDAVLHEVGRINLFGLVEVNPALAAGFVVSACMLIFALLVRIFVIPRFKVIPGKFQLILETWVGTFSDMAKASSPHKNKFLGAYIFAAGSYIAIGTLFELFGLQAITSKGEPIALSAPIADINGALMIGVLSYLVIFSGGITNNGIKGALSTIKEFSLPVSMSFRIFGALLSGLLVTELVYFYIHLSILLPVVVGVLFTLLHAIIQAYVLTMLTAMFYGEVSESEHEE